MFFIADNGKPPTLVTSMIDYNMPITMAYMKHMKLQLLNSQQDEVKPEIFWYFFLLCSFGSCLSCSQKTEQKMIFDPIFMISLLK